MLIIDKEIKQVLMEESSKDKFVATENNMEILKEIHKDHQPTNASI